MIVVSPFIKICKFNNIRLTIRLAQKLICLIAFLFVSSCHEKTTEALYELHGTNLHLLRTCLFFQFSV